VGKLGIGIFSMLARAHATFGPLKPLRFQFISTIFSFQIHIFLTKVLRFIRDFCLFYSNVVWPEGLEGREENFSFSASNELEKNVYKGNRQV